MAITIKQQPEELSASGNRMYFLVHTDRTNTINYKMTAQIQLIESANKVVELPLMRLYPNADGDVDMDISKIIDNRLRPEFPGLETNEYCKLKGFTLQYKVVFTEEGNYIPINSTTTDILTAVKGKFPASPSEFIRKNDFLTNFRNSSRRSPFFGSINSESRKLYYQFQFFLYRRNYQNHFFWTYNYNIAI